MKLSCLSATFLIVLSLLSAPLFAQEEDVKKMCHEYVELLKYEKYNDAIEYWSLLDRTRTEELKIEYIGCPVKLEVGSPLWQYIDEIRAGEAEYRVSLISTSRDFAQIKYSIITATDTVWGMQYALLTGLSQPRLVSPTHVYSDSWEQEQTDFIRLRYRDNKLYSPLAGELADDFIRETASILGVSNEKMLILETLKLNGFLCGTYGEVSQMAGEEGLGAFVKSYDGVVSKYFPPYNELARFMVVYANDNLPPATLPLLEHGTATFLGGRWGRSAQVLSALGSYLYQNDLVNLDTLITAASFKTFHSNPDFAYPLAGLFCEFLFNKLGREEYFRLYREMSGDVDRVNAITSADFKQAVTASTGLPWDALVEEFKSWLPENDYGGMSAGASTEGELRYESGLKGVLVRIFEAPDAYNVVAELDSPDIKAAVLLRQRMSDEYGSFLFEDQFPDTLYDDYHYGILFSTQEAGTYSYLSNVITGKYISMMTGDEPIYDSETGGVRFRIDKALLPPLGDFVLHMQLVK